MLTSTDCREPASHLQRTLPTVRMTEEKDRIAVTSAPVDEYSKDEKAPNILTAVHHADDALLAELGYKSEFRVRRLPFHKFFDFLNGVNSESFRRVSTFICAGTTHELNAALQIAH